MPTFERESHVAAPLDRVRAFHSTPDGLRALTPDWLGLTVEDVRGPDGERLDPGATLDAGSLLRISVRPFGVGPRRSWVSRITAREDGDGTAYFRDEMRQGPFRRWVHTHSFSADDGGTLVRDAVEFETPFGDAADAAARAGMAVAFAYRHRRTRRLLE